MAAPRHARPRKNRSASTLTLWLPLPVEPGVPAGGRHRAPPARSPGRAPAVFGAAALVAAGSAALGTASSAVPAAATRAEAAPLDPATSAARVDQPAASRSGTRESLRADENPDAEIGAPVSRPSRKHAKPAKSGSQTEPDPEAEAEAGQQAQGKADRRKVDDSGPPKLLRGCGYNARIQKQPKLDAQQRRNARTIVEVGQDLDLPPRAAVIALATAYQESWLRNLNWGDRDSLGLFQQRPSYGWGTPRQLQTPEYAAAAFYRPLEDLRGWKKLPVTVAAQAVQRSGFPDRYAQWELMAAKLVDKHLDVPDSALNCTRR